MPFLDIKSIKSEITLQMVLDFIGWKPRRSKDGQKRGKCPIHQSQNVKSVSFAVKDDGWFCHTCKMGGDQLALWKELTKLDTYAAVVDMCQTFNTTPYELPRHQWPRR